MRIAESDTSRFLDREMVERRQTSIIRTTLQAMSESRIEGFGDVDLADSPATYIRSKGDKNTNHFIIPDLYLSSHSLLAYVDTPAPVKGFTIDGVEADWRMPDETHPDALRLKRIHKSIPHWSVFMEHRAAFLNAIRPVAYLDVAQLITENSGRTNKTCPCPFPADSDSDVGEDNHGRRRGSLCAG